MKKYLIVVDSYGTFETDDEKEAYNKYNHFYDRGIPVAIYTRTQYSIVKTKRYL